jgi:hypothetical protein
MTSVCLWIVAPLSSANLAADRVELSSILLAILVRLGLRHGAAGSAAYGEQQVMLSGQSSVTYSITIGLFNSKFF